MLNLAVRAPLAVAIGAIAGALGRYYISRWVLISPSFQGVYSGDFPWGTFVVNVSGCLLMGFMTALGERLGLTPDLKLLILTGGLGAYTTFSTYSLETAVLLERGRLQVAGLYWFGSALVGLMALQLGVLLGRIGYGG